MLAVVGQYLLFRPPYLLLVKSSPPHLYDVDDLADFVAGELVDVQAELPLLVIAHGHGHVLLLRLVVQARTFKTKRGTIEKISELKTTKLKK